MTCYLSVSTGQADGAREKLDAARLLTPDRSNYC